MKIVADRLKKARELKGVTQTAVSRSLGINSKWILRARCPLFLFKIILKKFIIRVDSIRYE